MNIKQGKIKNISKKIIAGALVFTLASSAVVGYTVSNNIKLERQKYENFKGIASFGTLKNCYFIGLKDALGRETFHIARRSESTNSDIYFYTDLFSGKSIYISEYLKQFSGIPIRELTSEIRLEEYLYDLEMVKTMYSEDDVKEILQKMQELNKKETNQK